MVKHNYFLHIFLFLVTVFTTLMAGTELATNKFFFAGEFRQTFDQLYHGIPFSFAFLLFLTVHEFGHYFTARYYGVATSLPFYIPIFMPFFPINIGSFGAVIRIREVPKSRSVFFNIGVMGPLAGFVVALGLLVVGLLTLPPLEPTVFSIHPEYPDMFGGIPTADQFPPDAFVVSMGSNLLLGLLKMVLPIDAANLPPAHEMMHYPFLFVGFLVCFFTALNLLPIGQLDGGHVTYGLFGRKTAGIISRSMVVVLLLVGGRGLMWAQPNLENPDLPWWWMMDAAVAVLLGLGFYVFVFSQIAPRLGMFRWVGMSVLLGLFQFSMNALLGPVESNFLWLLYAFMAVRVIGVDHPSAQDEQPLNRTEKWMGYLAILIFILCFTPDPMVIL
jgi:membrane-associated protease RseP (regulator of RpoE activity)